MQGKRVSIVHMEIVRESSFIFKERFMRTPVLAVKMMSEFFKGADKEKVYVVCLNQKCEPLSVELVAIGTSDCAVLGMKDIFKAAILSNADGIIVLHNHLSGFAEPSIYDIRFTERLRQAGEMLGIKVNDHIILCDNGEFYSFKNTEK